MFNFIFYFLFYFYFLFFFFFIQKKSTVKGEINFIALSDIKEECKFEFELKNEDKILDEISLNEQYVKKAEKAMHYQCTIPPNTTKNSKIVALKYKIEQKFNQKYIPLRLLPSWQETQNCTNFLLLYEMNPKVPKIVDCIISVNTLELQEYSCVFKPDGKYEKDDCRFLWVIDEISSKSRKGKLIAQFVTSNKVKSDTFDVQIDFSVPGMIISGLEFEISDSNEIKFAETDKSFGSAYYFGKQ